MYIILGTALDGISMIVLTTAVVLPMIEKAVFDLVWSASSWCSSSRWAEVSRPSASTSSCCRRCQARIRTSWLGLAAFFFLLVAAVAIVTVFPGTVMWLPKLVFPG